MIWSYVGWMDGVSIERNWIEILLVLLGPIRAWGEIIERLKQIIFLKPPLFFKSWSVFCENSIFFYNIAQCDMCNIAQCHIQFQYQSIPSARMMANAIPFVCIQTIWTNTRRINRNEQSGYKTMYRKKYATQLCICSRHGSICTSAIAMSTSKQQQQQRQKQLQQTKYRSLYRSVLESQKFFFPVFVRL